jgi:O-antigen/teichoic acid export membrane protein
MSFGNQSGRKGFFVDLSLMNRDFLKDISWSFFGGAVSGVILLATNVLVGRLLGPVEYGEIALITTVAQVVIIFVLFGMDRASLRAIAKEKTKEGKRDHLSTTLYVVIMSSGIFSLLYLVLSELISRWLGLGTTLLMMGLVYGLALSYKQLMDNIVRGLERFHLQATLRIIEAVLTLFSFLIIWKLFSATDSTVYIGTLSTMAVLFAVFCLFKIRTYLGHFRKACFQQQFSFGSLYLIASIFGIAFTSLDKFLIGKYMSFYELGIYSAYFAASVGILSQLNTIFNNVFVTIVAKNLDHLSPILKKLDRLILIGFIPLLGLSILSVLLIIKLFGSEYPFNLFYAFVFSLLALLISIFSINASIVQTYSKKSFKTTFYLGNTTSLLSIGLYIFVIKAFGLSIPWITGILILHHGILILICKYALYREGAYGPPSLQESPPSIN